MNKTRRLAVFCIAVLLVFAYGCKRGGQGTETVQAGTQEHEETGEHAHEGETEPHTHEGETAEHTHEGETEPHTHAEEGEESGPEIGLDGTYDEVRNGLRLILSFDSESSNFVGTLENVSDAAVSQVRVEVHLSNGTELGPTEPADLASGQKIEVKLSAADQTFNWWRAHAEAGLSEL